MTRGGVRISIRPDGTVHAETWGVAGDACLAWVPIVEQATGAATVRSDYLPEFFDTEEQSIPDEVRQQQEHRW